MAYSKTIEEYNFNIEKLKEYSPHVANSLEKVGPQRFAMAHFHDMRWDIHND